MSESGYVFPEKGKGQSWVVEKVRKFDLYGISSSVNSNYVKVKLMQKRRFWFGREELFNCEVYLGESWGTMDLDDLFGDVSYAVERKYSDWLGKKDREKKVFGEF